MSSFTPLPSTLGGLLIGAASALLLLGAGHIAGVSGILGSLLRPNEPERRWRLMFVLGLIAGGLALAFAAPAVVNQPSPVSTPLLVAGGLFVGFGTRLGSGCTSGHGVCGLGRTSPRSLAATLVFMATAGVTVFLVRHVLGGAS